ncbi:MAG: hypothetical protein AMXMBFR64_21760 [Myxococcales bacterium]
MIVPAGAAQGARNRRARPARPLAPGAVVLGVAILVEVAAGVLHGLGALPAVLLHVALLVVVAVVAARGRERIAGWLGARAVTPVENDPGALVALAASMSSADGGALLVPTESGDAVLVAGVFGDPAVDRRPVSARKGAVGACLAIGRPLRIAQVPERGDALPYRRAGHGVRSLLCLPVMTPRGVGVLCLERRAGEPFSELDAARLDPLLPVAEQLVGLQEAARSQHDRAGRSARSMEALRSIAEARTPEAAMERLLDAAATLSGCEHAEWVPSSAAPAGSLAALCIAERVALPAGGVTRGSSVPLRGPDDPWTRTPGTPARAIPLIADAGRGDPPPLGALCLAGGPPGCLSDETIAVLEPVAESAAAAMVKLEQLRAAEHAATTDPLTGLPNRAAFAAHLADRAAACRVRGTSMAVLMLDVDYFKRVNDTWGHPAGDAVLRTVAATLQEGVRRDDLAARWGGEEFAVVLAGVDRPVAEMLADRLRAAIAATAMPVATPDGPLRVTVSVGVSTYGPATNTPDTLVASADRALYQAKQSGRDRVVCA